MHDEWDLPEDEAPLGYTPPGDAKPIDLRAAAPRVKRVNRRALILLLAGVGILVAFAIAAALHTPKHETANTPTTRSVPLPSEALVDMPNDYSQVKPKEMNSRMLPSLGPPIHGEFGQAQLDERSRLAATAGQPAGQDPIQKEIEAQILERLKRAANARNAKVEFGNFSTNLSNAPSASVNTARSNLLLPASDNNSTVDKMNDRDAANRQDDKTDFAAKHRVTDPTLDQTVFSPKNKLFVGAGTVIPALFLTGINSDLPGQITAQISQPIYDTISGHHMLIPQGTTLIGLYDSRITYGQERVLLVWTRLRFPNGDSLSLEGMPGTDLSGYAGVTDQVNNHWMKVLSGVVMGSLLGASAQMANGSTNSTTTSTSPESFQQLALGGAAQNLNQAGQEITRKNLSIQPTLEIRPGQRVGVFVTHDLVLPSYHE